jgi:hypothetical protein
VSDVVVDAGVFRLLQRFEPARVDKPREGQTVRMFDEVITMLRSQVQCISPQMRGCWEALVWVMRGVVLVGPGARSSTACYTHSVVCSRKLPSIRQWSSGASSPILPCCR